MPGVQLPRSFRLWGLLFAAAWGFGACGPGLPSTVPLGGSETPEQAEVVSAPSAENRGESGEPEADEASIASAPGAAGAGAESASEVEDETGSPLPGACQDEGGVAPECRDLETGACGALFGPICKRLARSLKPKIARAVADCMREKNRSSECSALEACAEGGLKLACATEAETKPCRQTLDRCGAPKTSNPWGTMERCEHALGAFTKESRPKVLECMKKSCELGRCFTQPLLENSG